MSSDLKGYVLCQAHGGINDMTCQIWICTDYAIKHNRDIILTHWSYFGCNLFDIFDFSNYPVKVYQFDHLRKINYDAVEPASCTELASLLSDMPNNFEKIHHIVANKPHVFYLEKSYDKSTLLVRSSWGGGFDSVNFFRNIEFTSRFKNFFREKTSTFPKKYNALHIRHTDIKVDSDVLIKNLDEFNSIPMFIGTDDMLLKQKVLEKFGNAFSSTFNLIPENNLHYLPNKDILEWALVDLFVMVLSENRIEDIYKKTGINMISGFSKLIDALKPYKNDMRSKINVLL
jgi:hypothetical protein